LNYGPGTIEQNGNAAIPDPPLADAGTNSYWYNGRGPGMEYSINLVKLERGVVEGRYKANVIYTFTISNGVGRTRGDVVLTESAVDIIEQKGKDPQTWIRREFHRCSSKMAENRGFVQTYFAAVDRFSYLPLSPSAVLAYEHDAVFSRSALG
jgi:hypothetical protein